MKNITAQELRLRKYPDDKKRLEEEQFSTWTMPARFKCAGGADRDWL